MNDDDEIGNLKLWPLMDKSEGIYSIYPFHAFMKICPWRIFEVKVGILCAKNKLRISSQVPNKNKLPNRRCSGVGA